MSSQLGGSSQACAACKHQRRRCLAEKCPLAPYFPGNEPRKFEKVNRLYGICNLLKIAKKLPDPVMRNEAMRSIAYEAEMRSRFPDTGCLGVVSHLARLIQLAEQELVRIRSQIETLRRIAIHQHRDHPRLSSDEAPVMMRNDDDLMNAGIRMGGFVWNGGQLVQVNAAAVVQQEQSQPVMSDPRIVHGASGPVADSGMRNSYGSGGGENGGVQQGEQDQTMDDLSSMTCQVQLRIRNESTDGSV